jgi:hypothetical protein
MLVRYRKSLFGGMRIVCIVHDVVVLNSAWTLSFLYFDIVPAWIDESETINVFVTVPLAQLAVLPV